MPRMYESEETKQLLADLEEGRVRIVSVQLEEIGRYSKIRAVIFILTVVCSFSAGMGVGGMVFH